MLRKQLFKKTIILVLLPVILVCILYFHLISYTGSYGFDCSVLTMRLYQSQGINIPRDADEQAWAGTGRTAAESATGGFGFLCPVGGNIPCGYVLFGDGLMLHAPNSSSAVQIDGITDGFYNNNIWGTGGMLEVDRLVG